MDAKSIPLLALFRNPAGRFDSPVNTNEQWFQPWFPVVRNGFRPSTVGQHGLTRVITGAKVSGALVKVSGPLSFPRPKPSQLMQYQALTHMWMNWRSLSRVIMSPITGLKLPILVSATRINMRSNESNYMSYILMLDSLRHISPAVWLQKGWHASQKVPGPGEV